MRVRLGCELRYEFPKPTPFIAMLNVHYSRAAFLARPDQLVTTPPMQVEPYRDPFGNWCSRLVAPAGQFALGTDTAILDDGAAGPVGRHAIPHNVEHLPADTLLYLLGSPYCETDELSDESWVRFGHLPRGWSLVQAICDFVHDHVTFGYEHSRPTRTAVDTYAEGRGVCRDFTHLAMALCRCMNVPARYCTGYLTDIGQPPPHGEMDFTAWMEVYLGDSWWVFDPRNYQPCIGRVLIARGRDAADVPLTHTFGSNTLTGFCAWAEEEKS
jgi:transglutaminase-like putative cysteine protease